MTCNVKPCSGEWRPREGGCPHDPLGMGGVSLEAPIMGSSRQVGRRDERLAFVDLPRHSVMRMDPPLDGVRIAAGENTSTLLHAVYCQLVPARVRRLLGMRQTHSHVGTNALEPSAHPSMGRSHSGMLGEMGRALGKIGHQGPLRGSCETHGYRN